MLAYLCLTFAPKKTAKGMDLMLWVTTQLNISEKEYFGLLWQDGKGEKVQSICLFMFRPKVSFSLHAL